MKWLFRDVLGVFMFLVLSLIKTTVNQEQLSDGKFEQECWLHYSLVVGSLELISLLHQSYSQ